MIERERLGVRWAESIWGDRNCQLMMISGRTTMLREKLEKEFPMGNIEKDASEKAGCENRKTGDSDSRVDSRCQKWPRVTAEKDPLHLAARS